MFGYIYITKNKINNKKYIGKKYGDYNPKYLGSGILLMQAVKKYGADNFTNSILKECSNDDELNFFEKHFIEIISPEYNIAEGGTGGNTLRFSDENKRKLIIEKRANAIKQTWSEISDEQRKERGRAISIAKKGKSCNRENYKHSEETKKKIAESNKKPFTLQHKINHSIAMEKRKGIPNSKCFKKITLNGVEYNSMKEACLMLHISFPTLKKRLKNEEKEKK